MLVRGFTDIQMMRAGINTAHYGIPGWGASVTLDTDISPVFPYINAALEASRFFDSPQRIQFFHENTFCCLFSREFTIAPLRDETEARRTAQEIIGIINDIYGKRHTLQPDSRHHRKPPVFEIFKLLPGTNCRQCGYDACMAMAAAVSDGQCTIHRCPEFRGPVYEETVLPVFNADGTLSSTITLWKQPAGKDTPATAEQEPLLSDREIQVLELMARGATNNQIADRLAISPHTVKSHVINIFNKLNVNDRTRAAYIAAKRQII